MNTGHETATAEVLLVGGPQDLAGTRQVHRAVIAERKIKLRYGSGHEHFTCADEATIGKADEPIVFQWSYRTRIAE